MDLPEGEASPVCPKGYLGWHYLFTEIEEQSDANSYHNLNFLKAGNLKAFIISTLEKS